MIKHPWKCNYAATLSPEILHFQNFVVFFLGGKHAIRPPIRGQKNYLLAACLYFGSYRSPFFHTYRVDSSDHEIMSGVQESKQCRTLDQNKHTGVRCLINSIIFHFHAFCFDGCSACKCHQCFRIIRRFLCLRVEK